MRMRNLTRLPVFLFLLSFVCFDFRSKRLFLLWKRLKVNRGSFYDHFFAISLRFSCFGTVEHEYDILYGSNASLHSNIAWESSSYLRLLFKTQLENACAFYWTKCRCNHILITYTIFKISGKKLIAKLTSFVKKKSNLSFLWEPTFKL